jgi:3-methylcrotonyl-CoA carboxylase alpha subunit
MKKNNFNRILVANRGEIALRIIRAIKALGKSAIVVHSFSDRELPFVREADEAFSLGSAGLAETYLDQSKILRIAREAGADAIHPGYGFLAENADFARRCEEEKMTFIGPTHQVISIMGDKSRARMKALEIGLPLLNGFTGEPGELIDNAPNFPYPVLIKPSAGGGGKGMRIVQQAEQFAEAAMEVSREAENYFGSGDFYVEQYLVNPRHIEVQVMADLHGNAVHLFERECSIQRRYQKIIEEAPSISLSPQTRKLVCESALKLVKGVGYTNAGTVEFLMDDSGAFYFLEMNTRIQVEHPVSEMITGVDLVKEQIFIAEGDPLSFSQENLQISGHAMEARIYAENPEQNFLPSTGTIGTFQHSDMPGIRIDSGYQAGNRMESFYDPIIAKVIAHGKDREDARCKLVDSLLNLHITGLITNRDYLVSLLQEPFFAQNQLHTSIVEQESESIMETYQQSRDKISPEILVAAGAFLSLQAGPGKFTSPLSPWEAIGHWRLLPEIYLFYQDKRYRVKYKTDKKKKSMKLLFGEREYEVSLEAREGEQFRIRIGAYLLQLWATTKLSEIHLDVDGHMHTLRRLDLPDERYINQSHKESIPISGQVLAPLNGRIIKMNLQEGDEVEKGQALLVIESMKMENLILAPHRSLIKKSHVSAGDQVYNNQLLITLDTNDRSSDQ